MRQALLAGLCNPVLAWVQHVAKRNIGLDLGIDDMTEVDRLHESGELEAFFAARRRAYEDRYRAEGVARGIDQEERREVQKEHLLEERFLRHVAVSEQRIRKDLGKEIADVRKEITTLTRRSREGSKTGVTIAELVPRLKLGGA